MTVLDVIQLPICVRHANAVLAMTAFQLINAKRNVMPLVRSTNAIGKRIHHNVFKTIVVRWIRRNVMLNVYQLSSESVITRITSA